MALANRVLRAVFDAESGMGAPTSLTTRCLALTGCKTVDELLRRKVEHKISRAQQHQLPIIVEEESLKEDAVSMQILTCFGRDEAAYAVTAIRRMCLQNESVDVILSGSIFKCSAPVLKKAVEETIHSAVPLARIIESVWEPAIGALLLALDDIGTEEQGIIHQHIERDAKRFNMVRNKTKAKER